MGKIPSRLVPQVRNFEDPIRVLRAISNGARTKKEIADISAVRERQIDYARNTAEALGWIESSDMNEPTDLGRELLAADDDSAIYEIVRKSIRQSHIINLIAPSLLSYRAPSMKDLVGSIQRATEPPLGTGTAEHRAKGLLKWRKTLIEKQLIKAKESELQLTLIDASNINSKPAKKRAMKRTDSDLYDSEYGPQFTDLRDSLRKSPRNAVVITGAGIGKLSRLPLWSELREAMCSEIERDAALLIENDAKRYRMAEARDVRRHQDLWIAFSKIRRILGEAAFARSIRRLLTPEADADANPFYDRIWSLGIRGVVTFNIDETAEQAYAHVFGDTAVACDATTPQTYSSLLHADSAPFVFHPHGKLSHPPGWTFTLEERDSVLNNAAYVKYMSSLLMTKTVILAGFNPNDISFEKHVIENVRVMGEDAHRIYIICAKEHLDPETYERYKSWGVRVVAYPLQHGEQNPHIELLRMLDRICEYIPGTEIPASIFDGQKLPPSELPTDQVLAQLPEEVVRERLNAAVAYIVDQFSNSEKDQIGEISDLFNTYPRSSYKAWFFVPGHTDLGKLFGRDIEEEIGGGAFGKVYKARSGDDVLAVKVLLSEAKKDPSYLLSFRRGIKSMRILEQNVVQGMVRIKDSYEVPPSIFMEYIDGLTLDDAVEHGFINTMRKKLSILERVADIVSTAHELDQVVLHRDIKPANVMLRSPVYGDEDFDVVVLDFDLSWHVGSHELSVAHNARMQGYAAPEQVKNGDAVPSVKTRNIAVDSFGFGMLAFFVFLERHPIPGEQRTSHFARSVYDAASKVNDSTWRRIPRLITNLVHGCIQDEQSRRPSVREAQIVLRGLLDTIERKALSADDLNLRYELLDRVFEHEDYTDSLRENKGILEVDEQHIGIVTDVALLPLPDGRGRLSVVVRRIQTERDHRSTFDKYISGKLQRGAADLRSAGFEDVRSSGESNAVAVSAEVVRSEWTESTIRQLVSGLQGCRHQLTSL